MANAYSILHNYAGELYTPNLQLIQQAMQYKEESLSAGRQKLSSMRSAIGNLDVAREVDQEYIDGRFKAATNIVDQYANLDLSDAGLASQLTGKLGEIMDETAKTAVLSTRLLQAENQEWAKQKEDNPDKYSDENRAFAMQNAQQWMANTDVGKKYSGGGGFIEYRDNNKKLIDNIPTLQKALEAEWIEVGPNQGYFREVASGKEVDKNKLNEALRLLFDPKDMKQMSINAWAEYDKAPEESIKAEFDSKQQVAIDYYQGQIDIANENKMKGTIEEQKQLEAGIQEATEKIKNIKNNSFEANVKAHGVRGIYESIYKQDFFESASNTFSYKNISKIEIEETIESKNAEVDMKIKKHNMAMAVGAAKIMESEAKTNEANGGNGNVPIVQTKKTEVTPGADTENYVKKQDDLEATYINQMQELLINEGAAVNKEEASELLKDPEVNKQIRNMYTSGSDESIVINKKSINKADNKKIFDNYNTNILQTSQTKQYAFGTIKEVLNNVETTFRKGSREVSPEYMPNFQFQYVKGKNGEIQFQDIKNDGNLYGYLMANAPKTPEGRTTLEIYKAVHLARDPELSPENRGLAQDYVNHLISKLPKEVRIKTYEAIKGALPGQPDNMRALRPDFFMSQITKGDLKPKNVDPNGERKDVVFKSPLGFTYTESVAVKPEELDGIDKIIKRGFENVNQAMSSKYATKNEMGMTNHNQMIIAGTPEHKRAVQTLGIIDPKYALNIEMITETTAEKGVTGKVKLIANRATTAAEKKEGAGPYIELSSKVMTAQELRDARIADFTGLERESMVYNAALGKDAPSIPLGNNKYSETKRHKFEAAVVDANGQLIGNMDYKNPTLPLDVAATQKYLIETGEDSKAKIIGEQFLKFQNGSYKFELQPASNGYYYMSINDGEKEVGKVPTIFTQFDAGEGARMLLEDPRELIEPAIRALILKTMQDTTIK